MNLIRHSAHLLSPSEALQRVFVPSSTFLSLSYPHQRRHSPKLLLPLQVRHSQSSRRTVEPKNIRSRRCDEDIDDYLVQVVSSDSNTLLPPQSPYSILARIDRETHSLVEVAPASESRVAVCRILSKQGAFEHEKPNPKEPKTKEKSTKQLEFSWTIDPNDLRHKLNKMKGFLEGGRKVELIIASRKARGGAKGREVAKEDRDKLVASIRAFTKNLNGVREWKGMAEVVANKKSAEQEWEVTMAQRKPPAVTVTLFYESTQSRDASDV